jgi:hypothetical protein
MSWSYPAGHEAVEFAEEECFGGHASVDDKPPFGWARGLIDIHDNPVDLFSNEWAMPDQNDWDLYRDHDGTTDIHLISQDGDIFKCHAYILAARSDYFRTLFTSRVGGPVAYSKDRPLELHCNFSTIVVQAVRDHIYIELPQSLGPALSDEVDVAFALPTIYKAAKYYGLPKLAERMWYAMKYEYGEADPWNYLVMLQSCLHNDVWEGQIQGFLLCNIGRAFMTTRFFGRLHGPKPSIKKLSHISVDCIERILCCRSVQKTDKDAFAMLELWATTVASEEEFKRCKAMATVSIDMTNIPYEYFATRQLNRSGIASADALFQSFQAMDFH